MPCYLPRLHIGQGTWSLLSSAWLRSLLGLGPTSLCKYSLRIKCLWSYFQAASVHLRQVRDDLWEHRDFFEEKKTVKFRCESGVHPAVSAQHGDYETQLWSHPSFSMHSTQVLLSTQLAPGRVNSRGVCEQPMLILINSFLDKHLS